MMADVIPLYSLYALLFADSGLSNAQITALFVLWSAVAFIAEVPTGALADRFSRRAALVTYGILQALGYALWITMPSFWSFAAGFVLWGVGGAFASGGSEALLYEGLESVGAESHYARIHGWVTAVGLVAQIPAALMASILFAVGGYTLVGSLSIGFCLVAALLACRLPEASRKLRTSLDEVPRRYVATLRAGLSEAIAHPAVRVALIAVAILSGFDGTEEYFPLLAKDWGLSTSNVPLAVLAISLAGATGAALGGTANRLPGLILAAILGTAGLIFGIAGVIQQSAGLTAVALFYGAYRMVVVVSESRLQHRIQGSARATVTSVAALGTELSVLLVYAAWAIGQVVLVAALLVLLATALPRLLGTKEETVELPASSTAL